ncbi:hypothetical protein [Spiroplasma endosymbiont of Cantharis lateralis]|uniref:hypothetical protein n=1 Tax=Spiroplasma endosymbiont of Cantharis lateralis TaxID=3066277 RepID=UPI00313DB227
MSNYANTPVYSNQLSSKQVNKNGNSYYFCRLNTPETIKSETIREKYGNVKFLSIIVPDFAVGGAKISKKPDKTWNLDKDSEGKAVEFEPLVLNESKKKESGKHILASISFRLPESEQEMKDESKVKIVATIFNEETKEYENKSFTTSYKNLVDDLLKQNSINVTNSIKKFKDKAKDIFNDIELANEIQKDSEFELIDDSRLTNDDSILWEEEKTR